MHEKIDNREAAAIRAIRSFLMMHGRTPSVRELMIEMGYKSPRSISLLLGELIQKGFVEKNENGKIRIVQFDFDSSCEESAQTVKIPLLGNVACGGPILAEENIEAEVPVSTKLLSSSEKYFLLRAKGDSMNLSGISDGDLVLIKQQTHSENGEKVVALIDDEATIKIFQKQVDFILLKPNSTNEIHQPIILTRDFKVQGVVAAVIPK